MNLLSTSGITRRLYALTLALSLALAGVAAVAYVKLNDAAAVARRTERVRVPQLSNMGKVELSVTRVSLQLRHAILSRTPEEQAAALADVEVKRKLIADELAAYQKVLFTEEGKRQFASIPPLLDKFWQVGGKNVALIKAGQKAEAFAYLVDETIPARNELLAAANQGVEYQTGALNRDIDTIASNVQNTLSVMMGVIATTIVGLGLFSAYLARTLRRRVLESQAVAERVRDGDLATAVNDSARDEFSPLLAALGDMQGALTRVVSGVRQGAESVATASAQIAQGNQDLSQRTEEQTSALQETASSMDRLATTVRQNADNARQANQLAMGASTVATEGGEVVGQVVATMKDINDSSRKIADIIGVIDSIAFQTNILALNAAVEAARAGEQGRGFAVVAGEVRSLAQRAAEAAKEIKSLITASVERVGQGTALVDQAGTTMQEIVASIRRVTDIMGEISAASSEQSNGVAQVGTAIAQMDQTTQQNAALVEQSAAAADSMRQQAQQLVQTVAVFSLSDAGPATSSATAPSPVAASVPMPAHQRVAKQVIARASASVRRKARASAAPAPSTPPASSGSDGNWESF